MRYDGCMDTTEIFLDESTDLSVTVASTNISCFGDDNGTITATPAGGTPISPSGTYNYSGMTLIIKQLKQQQVWLQALIR